MEKKIAFTICAKNYIGLARILEKSCKLHNSDYSFFIFVTDELNETDLKKVPSNVFFCKDTLADIIKEDLWERMAFQYDVTEFCTSVKPFCFQYLFKQYAAEKVIYLDPDIMVFSSFCDIDALLNNYKIIITPHITTIDCLFKGDRSEQGLLSTGLYNLGFLALTKCETIEYFLEWWAERLKSKCFVDVLDSLYTDQRWIDFLPSLFDNSTLLISNHLGLNLAPWNYFEREIFAKEHKLFVRYRGDVKSAHSLKEFPLVFVHFSGYDYPNFLEGRYIQKNIPNLNDYEDIKLACDNYSDLLKSNKELFTEFISYSYSYNYFKNGTMIKGFQRRLYRSLIEENYVISKPFSDNSFSFYLLLEKKGLVPKTNNNEDKINKFNLPDVDAKLARLNWIMRALFKIIGISKYILLLKLMRPYSKLENHIHLIDKKYSTKLK